LELDFKICLVFVERRNKEQVEFEEIFKNRKIDYFIFNICLLLEEKRPAENDYSRRVILNLTEPKKF